MYSFLDEVGEVGVVGYRCSAGWDGGGAYRLSERCSVGAFSCAAYEYCGILFRGSVCYYLDADRWGKGDVGAKVVEYF